jgi:DNA repair protein RadC
MSEKNKGGAMDRIGRVDVADLTDAELLELLFGPSRSESRAAFAVRVLEEAGGLVKLGSVRASELTSIDGVGMSKACRIIAAAELGRRLAAVPLVRGKPITSSRDVVRALGPRYARAPKEHFLAIALDAKSRPISEMIISVGSLSVCPVSPSDVFRAVVRENASGVIFVHNHPSGEPSPSPDDLALTERLVAVSELLGIRVVDHVILGDPEHFSFLDAGLIKPKKD